jgi:hypothetical protein
MTPTIVPSLIRRCLGSQSLCASASDGAGRAASSRRRNSAPRSTTEAADGPSVCSTMGFFARTPELVHEGEVSLPSP